MSPNLAVVLARGGVFGTHQRSSDGSGAPLGPCGQKKQHTPEVQRSVLQIPKTPLGPFLGHYIQPLAFFSG